MMAMIFLVMAAQIVKLIQAGNVIQRLILQCVKLFVEMVKLTLGLILNNVMMGILSQVMGVLIVQLIQDGIVSLKLSLLFVIKLVEMEKLIQILLQNQLKNVMMRIILLVMDVIAYVIQSQDGNVTQSMNLQYVMKLVEMGYLIWPFSLKNNVMMETMQLKMVVLTALWILGGFVRQSPIHQIAPKCVEMEFQKAGLMKNVMMAIMFLVMDVPSVQQIQDILAKERKG